MWLHPLLFLYPNDEDVSTNYNCNLLILAWNAKCDEIIVIEIFNIAFEITTNT